MPSIRVPRHVARLVMWLIVDYFTSRRLVRRVSGCLGTSRGSSRRLSSTTSTTPHVWVLGTSLCSSCGSSSTTSPRAGSYAARPGASARRAARHAARLRLLRLRRASVCLGTSRGSSRGSLSTTSPTLRVRVHRHVARIVTRLVTPLVIDYSASPSSSSIIWPTPHVRVPRHVARLVVWLIVDYFASRRLVGHAPGCLGSRGARHRLLRLHHSFGCLGTSCGSRAVRNVARR
jgi:hypothetical protein